MNRKLSTAQSALIETEKKLRFQQDESTRKDEAIRKLEKEIARYVIEVFL